MKKRIASLFLILSLLVSACAVLSGCEAQMSFVNDILGKFNEPDANVEGIRTAVQTEYGITYGAALDRFFTDPVWKSFVTDDGVTVVEVTGQCYFRNSLVNARIQFTIQEDGRHFETSFLSLNDLPQTEELVKVFFSDAFDAYLRG